MVLNRLFFQEAASVLRFLKIIISGRNADKCKQSLFKAFFFLFFFLFTLENSPSQSRLWFSECVMLVRPLNGMLITNWLSMSSFSYRSLLAVRRETHSPESSPWGRGPRAERGWGMKCSTHGRGACVRESEDQSLRWIQRAIGIHCKS